VNEAREPPLDDAERLIEQTLEVLDRPAVVCDADRRVRGWNDALIEDTAVEAGLKGAAVESVVTCEGDPLASALETGEETTGSGTVAVERGAVRCPVAYRPLESDGDVVGAVATLGLDDGEPVQIAGVEREGRDRERREREIRERTRRAELAMEATDTSVWERDLETGEVFWNKASEQLYGYDPGTFPGTYEAFAERVLDEDIPGVERQTARAVEEGGVAELEFRIQLPDGSRRWILSRCLVDDDPTRMVGIHTDITERKQRERELESLNTRLRLALEGTNTGVWEWNVETDEVIFDEQMECLFCFDPGEFGNDYDQAIGRIHPADVDDVETALDRGVEEGSYETEFRVHVDGTTERWIEARGETHYEDGTPARMVGICTDVTDRRERQRKLRENQRKLRTVVDTSPYPIMMKDREGRYQLVNEAAASFVDIDREEYIGKTPSELFGPEHGEQVRERTRHVLETGETETVEETYDPVGGERIFLMTRTPFYGPDDEIQGTLSVSRDVTERRRQQERLETLARIQQLIHESVGALATATTREEIRATVCERLAGSPFYEFAWIGERDPASQEIRPQCWDGVAEDYLDEIIVTADQSETGRGPGGQAYRSGEVAVVSDVDDDPDFAPWREQAAEHGFKSVAAVPLTHGSTTHGILAVYADRPGAFGEREIAGFEALGGTVGFALSAAQNRRLLESETVLRLEFLATSEEPAFRTASVEHGCRLVFDGVVGTGDGKTLCYLTVEDADPGVVEPAVEAARRVERVTRLDGTAGPHFELAVVDSTFQLLADAGARGTRIVVESGRSRIVAEAPTDVDVRRVRAALETNYTEVDFWSRTEVEPSEMEWLPTGEDVGARLTDRQQSVLRAAYYSGYYDWPRETDAESLAESFGVATPTVLQHLRRGHRQVMRNVFDS